MDVKLPNGTLLRNVPEGTPKHAIAMKAIRAGLAENKDFGYEEVEQDKATFLEGMGAGFTNVKNSLGNMVGLVDDETVENQREIDENLGGWGQAGKFTSEMLATAPIGMGVGGAVAKGANALSKGGRGANYLTRTLNRGLGRGAVEGATYGAVLADPNERGAGAVVGGAFGGALGAAGTALGKALGKSSLTQITKEAKQLQNLTGTFIPLSQSAEQGMTRMVYNAFLANIPGVGGKVRGQYQHALDDMRRFAAEHAIPDTAKAHNAVNLTGRETIDETITKLSQYWGDEALGLPSVAFDGIKKLPIVALKGHTPKAPAWLADAIMKHGKGNIKLPARGQTMTGAQMLDLKTALGEIIPSLGSKAAGTARSYTKQLDDLMKQNWDPTGKGKGQFAQEFANYLDASKYYPAWQSLKKAADKAANLSDFGTSQLAKSAKRGKGAVLPRQTHVNPQATQRRAGQLAVDALEDFPSKQGLFQTLAATAPLTSTAGAAMAGAGGAGVAAAFPLVVALGRLGASKRLQQYLSGQTRGQRLNKVLMKKYSDELQQLGATARQAAQILGVENGS